MAQLKNLLVAGNSRLVGESSFSNNVNIAGLLAAEGGLKLSSSSTIESDTVTKILGIVPFDDETSPGQVVWSDSVGFADALSVGQTGGTMQPVYFASTGKPTALKAFKNNTSKGSLGWSSSTNDIMAITSNTLAYWNGAYQGSSVSDWESNISVVGTIAKGTWQGSTIGVAYGGTGRNTLTSGYALVGKGTDAVELRAITNNTSATYITARTNLITANTLAYWNGAYNSSGNSRIVKLGTVTTGTWNATEIGVGYGGTGLTTHISNSVLVGDGVNKLKNIQSKKGAFYSTGTDAEPKFGTLPIAQGGTGAASLTAQRLVYTNADGTALTAGYHYVDSGKVSIAHRSESNYTFYVGTSKDANDVAAAGTIGVATSITIADEVTMQYDSTLKAMKFVF